MQLYKDYQLVTATTLITGSSGLITLAEARRFLGKENDMTDDILIDESITRAYYEVEDMMGGYRILTQTHRLVLDEFPSADFIELDYAPLASVTHLKYYDNDDTQQTWSSANYRVNTQGYRGHIEIDETATTNWPDTNSDRRLPIEIQFIVGQAVANVPAQLKHAILLKMYENVLDVDRSMEIAKLIQRYVYYTF